MLPRLFSIDTALLINRAVIRRFRENEGALLYGLIQDNFSRLEEAFFPFLDRLSDKETAEFFLREKLAAWLLQQEFHFGIWENESARLIGYLRIFNLDWTMPKGELDFFIDKDFSGQGLMTEALTRMLPFIFRQLQLEKVSIRTAMDNYPAQRLVRKVGWRREGDLRSEAKGVGGEFIDVMLFGLTRAEFEKV